MSGTSICNHAGSAGARWKTSREEQLVIFRNRLTHEIIDIEVTFLNIIIYACFFVRLFSVQMAKFGYLYTGVLVSFISVT